MRNIKKNCPRNLFIYMWVCGWLEIDFTANIHSTSHMRKKKTRRKGNASRRQEPNFQFNSKLYCADRRSHILLLK